MGRGALAREHVAFVTLGERSRLRRVGIHRASRIV
jgi:hypothetical protein